MLLAVGIMADYALAHGRLARPIAQSVVPLNGNWFMTAKRRQLPARTRKFRAWLIDEMSETSLE